MKAWLAGAAFALIATAAQAQGLALRGVHDEQATLTSADLAALPHETVKVVFHDEPHTFEGVPLSALLARVHAATGVAIRGRELATVVRLTARDGYQVVLGLAETDPGTRPGRVIVADSEGGKPLPAADGTFRLVISDDLRPARSARQLERIELLSLATTAKPGKP
ncbi:MAG: hypothetical protein JWQ46_2022 [Phenylobacterium sp.]|nr:hypothetical protein [Phenylobacterium sp.]